MLYINFMKKYLFFLIAVTVFIGGGYLTQKTSFSAWSLSLVLYLMGLHWVYAFIWNKDMHYHLGKVPYSSGGEHKTLRFCGFVFGLLMCLFIAFIPEVAPLQQ